MNLLQVTPQVTPQTSSFVTTTMTQDVLASLLENSRNPRTRKLYETNLRDFFLCVSGQEPSASLVNEFLALAPSDALGLAFHYRNYLQGKYATSTTNNRLASLRSFVSYAQRVGKCKWNLDEVKSVETEPYRDTKGVEAEQFQKILAVPDRTTLKGKRDYAILCLLWSNALRREEIAKTLVKHFDAERKTLRIFGKGKADQFTTVSINDQTTTAIQQWLLARGKCKPTDPLFMSISNSSFGKPLQGNGLFYLIRELSKEAGIQQEMSPHRCRHSSITAALNATNGNLRKVQDLSRHARIETVVIYDDNRTNAQGGLTNLLGDILESKDARSQARERIAEFQYEQRREQMRYFLENLTDENIEQWRQQCEIPFSDLSDIAQANQRGLADEIIKLIG